MLKDRFPFVVIKVIVTAVGGEESSKGASRFAKEVLCHNPDVLLIDYGMNDHRIGTKQASKAWRSMIENAIAARSRLLLCTPAFDSDLALGSSGPGKRDLPGHAAQIRELARII
jgi:acyl-CoA thioesterase I